MKQTIRLLSDAVRRQPTTVGRLLRQSRRNPFRIGGSICGLATTAQNDDCSCPFGLLLDIDGVLFRGRDILPHTKEAFQLITKDKKFKVPTVFVTNSGNSLRATKAEQLSERLGVPVSADQVVMSHSPLRTMTEFHDKHVLVIGQGPIQEIARQLGFTRTTTLNDLRVLFPHLDCVDYKRRRELLDGLSRGFQALQAPNALTPTYTPIEVVVFGEPIRWESAIQYLMDVLITSGKPDATMRGIIPYPHIPLLACNMDFLWMAETPLPRIANGAFLLMVETMYKKLTGKHLIFTAMLGKPTELTYYHAETCVTRMALSMGMEPPKNLYAIGDNPETDIFGANLFNSRLKTRQLGRNGYSITDIDHLQDLRPLRKKMALEKLAKTDGGKDESAASLGEMVPGVAACYSILVETGVWSRQCQIRRYVSSSVYWKNIEKFDTLKIPTYTEGDILSALRAVERKEGWDFATHRRATIDHCDAVKQMKSG